MIDLNHVKAGDYELVATQFDQIVSAPGQPVEYHRHRTGDVVTLDVEEARRLAAAGAIIEVGARQRAEAEAARVAYEAALAALNALPEDVRAQLAGGDVTTVGPKADDATTQTPEVERPAKGDTKAAWIAYAVSRGIPEAEAKKLNKDPLIERIEELDAAEATGDPEGDTGGAGDPDGDGASGDDSSAAGTPGTLPTEVDDSDETHELWVAAAVEREVDEAEARAMSTAELRDLLT